MKLSGWNLLDKRNITFEIADILAVYRDQDLVDIDKVDGRTPVLMSSIKAVSQQAVEAGRAT